MKRSFIVRLGHEKGDTAVRVIATTKEEVESIFASPWKDPEVYAEEDVSDWALENILESDAYNQEPWLKNIAYSHERMRERKTSYPVKGTFKGKDYYRNLWLRDKKELERLFPSLELQYWVPWKPFTPQSDIDVEDEFTSLFRVDESE